MKHTRFILMAKDNIMPKMDLWLVLFDYMIML
jgi:hypothetical protein